MQERLRHYGTVTTTDCINASSLLHVPRTQVLVAAELTSNALNELHSEAKTTFYEGRPRRRLTPDTIPIPRMTEKAVAEPLQPASWPTVLVIAFIALIAVTIIIAARSRNQTAYELFESLWRSYTTNNAQPAIDTKTLVGPMGREGDKLSER
jgi:hypothetical protein